MQFNLVNNKEMLVFPCIWVHDGAVCLAVSGPRHTCTGSHRSWSVTATWNHIAKSIVRPFHFFMRLFSVLVLFLFFCFPPTTPPFFFSLSTVIPVWRLSRFIFVGAHGSDVAGIASHGSILLSRGWLITVEAPGHPTHPPSTQLNAVVNRRSTLFSKLVSSE